MTAAAPVAIAARVEAKVVIFKMFPCTSVMVTE
jgi:hypothetical protein